MNIFLVFKKNPAAAGFFSQMPVFAWAFFPGE
jgi:hypothetical protein